MTREFTFAATRLLHERLFRSQVVALLGLLLLSLPAYCQVYAYSDAYDTDDSVAGYSSVTGYYNSSTHVYTTNITIYSPSGRSSSGSTSGTSASTSLSLNLEHGVYALSANFVGTCPNPSGGGNHTIGGSGDSVTVAPYCVLGEPALVGGSTTPADLKVSVFCTAQTDVTVAARVKSPNGTWTLQNISPISHSVSAGGSVEFSPFTFQRNGVAPTDCPCNFKAGVEMTSPTGTGVKGGAEKYIEMPVITVNP